jgi:hypothetical protein
MRQPQQPMRTIKVDGKDYPYRGLVHAGKGILTEDRVFIMFPAVRWDGSPVEPLPLIGPREIHRVTARTPDLTQQHPEIVKEIFELRRRYHERITLEEHVKEYPSDGWFTEAEFETARARIMAESLGEFAQTERARHAVWTEHRTPELAERFGYIDFKDKLFLWQAFKDQGKHEDQAWAAISTLNHVAIYDDPSRTRIYLLDLKEEPITEAEDRVANHHAAVPQAHAALQKTVQHAAGASREDQENISDLARMIQESRAETQMQHAENMAAHAKTNEKLDAHEVKKAPAEPDKPVIVFANGFRLINHPTGDLPIPRARNRARALKELYTLWSTNPGEWADWSELGMRAGYTDTTQGFFRNVEDRDRPEIRRVLESFVEEGKDPTPTSMKFRVRLKTCFRYLAS